MIFLTETSKHFFRLNKSLLKIEIYLILVNIFIRALVGGLEEKFTKEASAGEQRKLQLETG